MSIYSKFYPSIFILFSFLLLINIIPAKAQYNLESGIWDAAWNPNGTLLAVANPNGQVYIYDTSGDLVHTFFGHDQRALSVTWSPNGEILASGGYDRFIRFWNVETGELLHEMDILLEPVIDLAWQPNGTYLAIAAFDTIQVWDTTTYEPLTEGVAGNVLDIEWNPDGSNFAFGSPNTAGIARIDGDQFDVGRFLINSEPIRMRSGSVSWNSAGTQIITTHPNEGVYIWDAKTRELVNLLLQNDEEFADALFIGEDDTQAVVLTTEGSIYVLDVHMGEVLESMDEDTFLWSLAWNPEHNLLAISGTNDTENDDATTGFLTLRALPLE